MELELASGQGYLPLVRGLARGSGAGSVRTAVVARWGPHPVVWDGGVTTVLPGGTVDCGGVVEVPGSAGLPGEVVPNAACQMAPALPLATSQINTAPTRNASGGPISASLSMGILGVDTDPHNAPVIAAASPRSDWP